MFQLHPFTMELRNEREAINNGEKITISNSFELFYYLFIFTSSIMENPKELKNLQLVRHKIFPLAVFGCSDKR